MKKIALLVCLLAACAADAQDFRLRGPARSARLLSAGATGSTLTLSGALTGTTATLTGALTITTVASGQGAIEIPTGARIWTDGAAHARGVADGFLIGDWSVTGGLAVSGAVSTGTWFAFTLGAIGTCSAPAEGRTRADILSGGAATGKRTKLCLCTSDGSGNYAWQNLATGTVGNATTCGTE